MTELILPGSGAALACSIAPDRAMRPLHIVHVLTRLLRAGSEENTIATCRWQAAQGHRVTLIHGAEHDPGWTRELEGTVTLRAVPEMIHRIDPASDWRALQALKQMYRKLSPDVIHTHQSKAGILGRLAASAVPQALVVHGIHILPWEGVGSLNKATYIGAERVVDRRTDQFIAVSDSVAEATLAAGIGTRDRIHTVYSGMDLAPFRRARPPKDADRLIGPHDAPVILMLAAFEPRKRHVAFLRALPQIIAKVPNLRLILAGAGPEEAAVRAAVERLGLTDHVTFCGYRPDPAALIALADLTVLTSMREGLPRVVVQSIAAGCPVVVTRLPGIAEIVTDGVNGIVCDAEDLSRTADSIVGLLTNRSELDRLRAGARATDVSQWSLDRLGARTTAIYQAALARRQMA